MSDAAWGLSFGKFLELSFSNHATANRVATCGHSLQKDCLRYYGYSYNAALFDIYPNLILLLLMFYCSSNRFGSMVAIFRYSPIEILSVNLPLSVLEFNQQIQQALVKREATEVLIFNSISSAIEGHIILVRILLFVI